MRIKRTRQFSKVLSTYSRCFGLNSKNLEVFLDHTFVRQALLNHVNIFESITNLVGRGFQLVTSSCVIDECRALGSLFFGTLKILEGFNILKCRHEYNPSLGADWCIRKRIRTTRKHSNGFGRFKKGEKCFLFVLASNDEQLRILARRVPGMPIMFIAQRCVNTELIPDTTQHLIDLITSESLAMNDTEIARLREIEEKFSLLKDVDVEAKKKHRRGPAGPNPLSCRKRRSASAAPLKRGSSSLKVRPQRPPRRRQRALRKTWAMCRVLDRLYGNLPVTNFAK